MLNADVSVLAGCSWMCGAWTARWCRAVAWAPASTTRSTSAGLPTVRLAPHNSHHMMPMSCVALL